MNITVFKESEVSFIKQKCFESKLFFGESDFFDLKKY